MTTLQRRRLLLGSRPFSPTQLPGLALWNKGDAITGLSDGDPVASWLDSSGNGRTWTQATASKKPTFKTGVTNSGLPAVLFDGIDDLMTQAAFGVAAGGTTGSHYAVVKVVSYAVGVVPVVLDTRTWNATPATLLFFLSSCPAHGINDNKLITGGRFDAAAAITNLVYGDEDIVTGAWEIWETHCTGSAWEIVRNGRTQVLTTYAGTNTGGWFGLDPAAPASAGSGLSMGGTRIGSVDGNWANMYLTESALYNNVVHTADQRRALRNYLSSRFQIPVAA